MSVLLLERHDWETSGSEHQIQIPKTAFLEFFGTSETTTIQADIFDPPNNPIPIRKNVLLSYYKGSGTYRINGVEEFGALEHAVIVIEETTTGGLYNIWWFTDADANTILSRQYPWQQAKDSQHGPGRKWVIISGPGPQTP